MLSRSFQTQGWVSSSNRVGERHEGSDSWFGIFVNKFLNPEDRQLAEALNYRVAEIPNLLKKREQRQRLQSEIKINLHTDGRSQKAPV